MKRKLLITALMYILLILVCFFLVLLVDRLAGSGPPAHRGTPAVTTDEPEPESGSEENGSEESTSETQFMENDDGTEDVRAQEPTTKEQEETKEEKGPPKIIFATDLHYMSSKMTDYGEAFEEMMLEDDGKVTRYLPELVDAFLSEVIREKPDALVLSGDITFNGEKENHLELAEKLMAVQDAGIQVLVIPGNHDINNPKAAAYFGTERKKAENVTTEEFGEIYQGFGYDQSISRDVNSLSYLYPLDDRTWLLMLDTCQYEPVNLVGGKIEDNTYVWMEAQFEAAAAQGIQIIPIAHHNLLKESRVYTTECDIENGEKLVAMLEKWQVPVFLSGHLHLQRIKKFYKEPGTPKDAASVYEIVTGSVSIFPCQYAVVSWSEDREISYRKRDVDVNSWARAQESVDENLLDFENYSAAFAREIVAKQTYRKLSNLREEQMWDMAMLYGELNLAYCAGVTVEPYEVVGQEAYAMWERNRPDSDMFRQIKNMMADLKGDYISWDSGPLSEYE